MHIIVIFEHRKCPETRLTSTISDFVNILTPFSEMYEGVYSAFMHLLCIFVYTFIQFLLYQI